MYAFNTHVYCQEEFLFIKEKPTNYSSLFIDTVKVEERLTSSTSPSNTDSKQPAHNQPRAQHTTTIGKEIY